MDKRQIKLIVMDVDGVLTDGKLYIGADGNEYKSFNVKDGMGISIAKAEGIKFAIISGRNSKAVEKRAQELGIEYVYQGVKDKSLILENIMDTLSLQPKNVIGVGDDINDLHMLKHVDAFYCPADANPVLISIEDIHVLESNGGNGVVRELVDKLLDMREHSTYVRSFIDSNASNLKQ
jgi:3-deoxy-D-manno-octulosonate 8-phosphate phosphatase (KDO 8-P phosphatase)